MLRRACLLSTLLVLSACSGETEPPPPTKGPRIISFKVAPSQISVGEEVTLTWETVGTMGVNIEPRIGLQLSSGSTTDRPLTTTKYVLTIPGASADLRAEATVEVTGGAPRVEAFTATPRTIMQGESSLLEWVTANADDVIIEPGIGTRPANGSVSVMPMQTTTYRLTAKKGTDISQPAEVTVVVASGNQPFIRSFTASPQTIQAGDPVTLAWDTTNANVVTISGVPGQHAATGSVMVNPQSTTTYTLNAVGDGGQANASVTVTVNQLGNPTILFFNAAPATIAPGGTATLSWDTDNADGVTIDNGVGNQMAKGSVTVQPAMTTTYTLTAYNAAAQVTAQATVTVAAANQPVIVKFDARPSVITQGGTTTLSWNTQNTPPVDIDNGVGTGLGPNDSIQVSPTQTTTYTMTAQGPNGMATAQVTVTVNTAAPVVVSFTASPASISSGGTSALSWQTTNATSVSIDNGVGMQSANGTAQVSPTQTTQYTLTATGPGGQATAQVTVTVTQQGAPQINSFTATPQQIAPGGQSTLAWSVSMDATSVTIDNGIGAQSITGSTNVSPATTTTYTLTAVGPGGQTTAQVTISVVSVVGDTCNDAFDVTGNGTFTGNTNTATNDYQDSNSCTGYRSTGPDTVYRVSLQAGDRLQAVLTPVGGWDASIYVVTSCGDVASSCVAGQDNGGADEQIDYTAAAGGVFYIIVDGFAGAGGDYSLAVTITAAPILNDQCSGAIDVTAGGAFAGNTTNATGDYNPGFGGCTGYSAASRDVTYRVTLAAGERLQASLSATWDAALYVVTDCANIASSCVAGQDDGNPEEVDYTAPSGGTFFLIVDGWGTNRGAFNLTVSISPPVQGGDTCQTAVPIPAGGGSFQSTTAGLNNDYDPPVSCTDFAQQGPDQAYAISLGAGDIVEALAEFDTGLDGSLYVVTNCADLNTCVQGSDNGLSGQPEAVRFVAQSATDHFLIVDAFSASASGGHDLTVAHYTGDVCADAAPLNTGDVAEWYSTAGKANDYSPNSGGCTGYTANGPDRAYAVYVIPGDQLQVTVDPDGYDASLYVVSSCSDISGSCIAGSDEGVTSNEEVMPVFQQSGLYYVIVDGFSGGQGSGTITARYARGDTCADAYRVPAQGGTFRGTTAGYGADYGITSASGSCTNFAQVGADAVYAIDLANNETLTASLTTSWDAALYLITDCASSGSTCVAGQDNGSPEELTYTNTSGSPRTYYLVVDSWRDSTSTEGNYTLDITIN